MSDVNNLKDKLKGLLNKHSVVDFGSSLVPEIDYTEMSKKLKPEELGRERGAKDLPPLGTKTPDEIEYKIKNVYQELVDKTSKNVVEALITYNQRLMSLDVTGLIDNIRDTARGTIGEFKAEVIKGVNELAEYGDIVKSKSDDLSDFKSENNLKRSASYPTFTGRFVRIAIISVIFLIESVANSAFLRIANEGGMIGAYSEAIAISFVNVGTAFLIGQWFTRYLFGNNQHLKIIFIFLVFIAFSLSGLFNLAVAHYRELAGEGFFGDAGAMAIQNMLTQPFALGEFQSWVLFLMGWLFWIISLVDTHTMDDNFPNYGKVDRAHKLARENYSLTKADRIDDISEKREFCEEDIRELREDLQSLLSGTNSIINMREGLVQDFKHFNKQASSYFLQTLETYRNANRDNRTRSPASFNKKLELDIQEIDNKVVAVDLDHVQQQVTNGKAILDKTLDEFYEEFDCALTKFKRLDELEDF
jgi:hypothetical protein